MLLPICFPSAKEKVVAKVIDIPIEKIVPNPNQPRKRFDMKELRSLADSIEQNGIIQPITVREHERGYEIVAGERRYRAAIQCGLEYVPCIIMDISECESAVMALVENIQRRNLDYFDEADAIRQMIDIYGITQEDAAARLGKNQSTIANKLRILKLSPPEREKLIEYELTERHARALLRIDDKDERMEMIETINAKKLNVEKTEKAIDILLSKKEKASRIKKRSGLLRHISLFANSINHAVDIMKASGVDCESKRVNGEGFVEFIIRVPTEQMSE